jgi:phosphatidylglycerophosphatase A
MTKTTQQQKTFPTLHKIVATACGFGFFPYGPGTMGAIFAIIVWLPLFICCSYSTWLLTTAILTIAFTVIGAWSANISEHFWGPDPSRVVIDEVVGMWIALLAVADHASWWQPLLAFILFRFFDIVKPLGVRKMEQLPGGIGIMADDVLAGIYSAIILLIINWQLA